MRLQMIMSPFHIYTHSITLSEHTDGAPESFTVPHYNEFSFPKMSHDPSVTVCHSSTGHDAINVVFISNSASFKERAEEV